MKIWERLRIKTQSSKQERDQLLNELFSIITGRMREFVLKHDAVRAVQTAIKFSNREQRKEIAKELQGSYVQLAESRYAKFLIGKLMVQSDEEIRDMILSEFYGKVRKLINHPEASWILDDTYRTLASKEQKSVLLREWYGPEFSLLGMTKGDNQTADLKQILEEDPSKRGPILRSLWEMINSLVQKKMTGFTMLHDAMLQYFSVLQPGTKEFNELIEVIKGDESGDLLKNLAFTRSGSRLVCLLLANGSAKDRKAILRTYKDTIGLMSNDRFAHVVLMTALEVIDDTKLTSKTIFPELLGEQEKDVVEKVSAAVNGFYARMTILYLLEGSSQKLFPESHSFDVEILDEVHEIRKNTSKKDAASRQKELVATMSPHLLAAIAAAPAEFVSTLWGCRFITDTLFYGVGEKKRAIDAIAQCAGGDPKQAQKDGEETEAGHTSHNPFSGRMLKSLIQGGRYDKEAGRVVQVEPPLGFANAFYPVIEKYIVSWATGPSSFVVVALMEAPDFEKAEALKKILRKHRKLLEKAASEGTGGTTASGERSEREEAGQKGRKGKRTGERPTGNVGSKILLEKL